MVFHNSINQSNQSKFVCNFLSYSLTSFHETVNLKTKKNSNTSNPLFFEFLRIGLLLTPLQNARGWAGKNIEITDKTH